MTPLYKIIMPNSRGEVYAKMERFNPTGTHKDRSLKPWILHYKEKGEKEFAIPSSGNSAISAAKICEELGFKLNVFVGENISEEKLSKLRKYRNVVLNISKNPRRDSMEFAKENGAVNLRSSTDDKALDGYKSIARELKRQLPEIDNIFLPTSSGSTLEGIYLGFKESLRAELDRAERGNLGVSPKGKMPSFYAIQTTKVHPIASYFDKNFLKEESSFATAIVDNIAHRRNRIIEIIKETGGGGYVISNKELEEAKKTLDKAEWQSQAPSGVWQSVLCFAGFLKHRLESREKNNAENEVSVCIFTD